MDSVHYIVLVQPRMYVMCHELEVTRCDFTPEERNASLWIFWWLEELKIRPSPRIVRGLGCRMTIIILLSGCPFTDRMFFRLMCDVAWGSGTESRSGKLIRPGRHRHFPRGDDGLQFGLGENGFEGDLSIAEPS